MNHLNNVCMTYKQHAFFSFYISWTFLKASVCAFLHAIFPCVLTKSSSQYARFISEEIQSSGCLEVQKLD